MRRESALKVGKPAGNGDIAAGAEPEVRLPRVLRWFWAASVAALGLMFLRYGVAGWLGVARDGRDPLPDPRFGDLLEYVPTFRLVHTAAFFHSASCSPVAYPPFGAVLFGLLYASGHAVALYVGIAAAWLGAAVCLVRRALREHGISPAQAILFPVTLTLVSFPIAGLLQRGNLELFVWMASAAGVWAYWKGREAAAGVLWGLAGAVKLYPMLLLVLLLPRRRLREFGLGVGTFAAATGMSMVWLGPSFAVAWRGSWRNVFGYQGVRVSEWSMHELAANHSCFGLVKLAAVVMGGHASEWTAAYYVLGGVVFAAVFFGRVSRMPEANQLMLVSVFMVLLPPVSYFYTLVQLYAPWLVLVFAALRADKAGARIRGLSGTISLFLPLFASFTLLTYRSVLLFGGLVQAGVLLSLLGCAACLPLPMPERCLPGE